MIELQCFDSVFKESSVQCSFLLCKTSSNNFRDLAKGVTYIVISIRHIDR